MNILILHQNFPGQFRHVAQHLVRAGHKVLGLGAHQAPGLKGIALLRYKIDKPPKATHPYLATATGGAVRGEVVARVALSLKQKGMKPDVILAHPGWGEALFVREVFPEARLVSLFEFYYHSHGTDVGFEPGSDPGFDLPNVLVGRNMMHLMNLELCHAGVSPTRWQKSLHPAAYQDKISVVHEGVDSGLMTPEEGAQATLPDGRVLRRGEPVVTYVARHLEPYRGFHMFMRALPQIQKRNPAAVVVVVGGDSVSYGRRPEGAANWREKLLAEVGPQLDLSRVVFTGQVPYALYRQLLRVSAAHVYLTYPFVLSWSMLEAMSCGCLVLGSATPPVQEVLKDGENGRLFDFFDQGALADRVTEALTNPAEYAPLREAARRTIVEGYGIERGIAGYMALLGA